MSMPLQHVWTGWLHSFHTDQPADVCRVHLFSSSSTASELRQLATPSTKLMLVKAADKYFTEDYPVDYCRMNGFTYCQIQVEEPIHTHKKVSAWNQFVGHMSGWRYREGKFLVTKRKLSIIEFGPLQGYMLPAFYERSSGITYDDIHRVTSLECWLYNHPGEAISGLEYFNNPTIRIEDGKEVYEALDLEDDVNGDTSQPPSVPNTVATNGNEGFQTAYSQPLPSLATPQVEGHLPTTIQANSVLQTPFHKPVVNAPPSAPVLRQLARPPLAPKQEPGIPVPPHPNDVSASSTNTTGSPGSLQHAAPPGLQTMGLHSSFLSGLSQNHESWIFGAIAELVDNARDADAGRLDIYVTTAQAGIMISDTTVITDAATRPMLVFEDNGTGMDYNTMLRALSMGHGKDEPNPKRIGCYGFGLKSGSMRIGDDVLVLSVHLATKEDKLELKTACVSLLSMTFNHNRPGIITPIIPLTWPSLDVDESITPRDLADQYWDAIHRISGFSRSRVLFELGRIRSTGTRIFIWNLRQRKSKYELQWRRTVPNQQEGDIFLADKVSRRRDGQLKDCQVPMDWSLREYVSRLYLRRKMIVFIQNSKVEPLTSQAWLAAMGKVQEYQEKVHIEDSRVELALRMGVIAKETSNHNCGVMMYHKDRLILSYQRFGLQSFVNKAFGVVGLFQAPNDVIRPTNNKQDFVDNAALKEVCEWVGQKVLDYYNKHVSGDAQLVPQEVALQDGATTDNFWASCEICSKWRRIPKVLDDAMKAKGKDAVFYCFNNQPYVSQGFLSVCDDPQEATDEGEVTLQLNQDGTAVKSANVKGKNKRAPDSGEASGSDRKKSKPS